MTNEEFAELKAVMANAARAAVESTVRTTIKDCLRPVHDRLESIEINVGAAISRMNAFVERRLDEFERRIEKLEARAAPDTDRPTMPPPEPEAGL